MAKTREEIVEFLAKLKARANDRASSEAEVQMALKTLQKLMDKHDIHESEILLDPNKQKLNFESMTKATAWDCGQRVDSIQKDLATVSCYLCNVAAYYSKYIKYDNHGIRREREKVIFYGLPHDVAVAVSLQKTLWDTVKTMARSKYGSGWKKVHWTYGLGFIHAMRTNARELATQRIQPDPKPGTELAIVNAVALAKNDLLERYRNENLTLKYKKARVHPAQAGGGSAYTAGKIDGAKVNLSRTGLGTGTGSASQKRLG